MSLHGDSGLNYLYQVRRGLRKYFQGQKLQPAKPAQIQTFRGFGELLLCPQAVLSKTCFPRSAKTMPVLMPAQYFLPKSHFSSLHSIFLTAFVLWSSDNIFTALCYRPFSGRPDCIKNPSQRQNPRRRLIQIQRDPFGGVSFTRYLGSEQLLHGKAG